MEELYGVHSLQRFSLRYRPNLSRLEILISQVIINRNFVFQTLFHGLQSLLEYQEDDIEEAFMQTFRICYQDVFGTLLFHDLRENGDTLLVNKSNRLVSLL